MTNSRKTASTALRWSARALALAAAYFVVAKIGLRYATIGPSISPVWPPTGLAVAALVLLGPGYWPAILVGAFLANAATSIPVLPRLALPAAMLPKRRSPPISSGAEPAGTGRSMISSACARSSASRHLWGRWRVPPSVSRPCGWPVWYREPECGPP